MNSIEYDILKHQTMACDSLTKPSDLPGGENEYLMEAKYDGFRIIASVESDGVRMWTREGKAQDGKLPHIEAQLFETFPAGTIVDGEVIATVITRDDDGMMRVHNRFEHVQSVMLSKPERAVQVQEDGGDIGWLKLMLFDVLMLDNDDVTERPLVHRREILSGFVLRAEGCPHIQLSAVYPAVDHMHEELVARGFEGSVVKRKDSQYWRGKSKGWWKIKAQHTVDVVVLGFTPGTGKYEGLIGAVIFGQPAPEGAVAAGDSIVVPGLEWEWVIRGQCSGMTDEQRRAMTNEQDDLVGAVFEITHNGLMAGGVKFRHPQFSRWRPDKPRSEVRWHDR